MKLIFTWFNIIELRKADTYNFGYAWIPIPMLELNELVKSRPKYLGPAYKKVYLGTYRKFTKKL